LQRGHGRWLLSLPRGRWLLSLSRGQCTLRWHLLCLPRTSSGHRLTYTNDVHCTLHLPFLSLLCLDGLALFVGCPPPPWTSVADTMSYNLEYTCEDRGCPLTCPAD
jgi:hypothetical protein